MEIADRIKAFQHELDMIKKPGTRSLTEECLRWAPDYFFTDCPSSSSGKYHPADEHCGIGTVLHTRRVARLIPDFATALLVEGYRDELVAAAILHDSVKQGIEKTGHTVREHPILAAEIFADCVRKHGEKLGIVREDAAITYLAILHHMGKWGPVQPKQWMNEIWCVHLADVAASRGYVSIKTLQEAA